MLRFLAFFTCFTSSILMGCASQERPIHITTSPEPRSIATFGEADVRVVPDEVWLTVGVETEESSVKTAKDRNDHAIKELQAAALAKGVMPQHMQTEYLELHPRYGIHDDNKIIGYVARKTVVLTIRDISQFESILSAVVDSGANRVLGIQFRTSELRKHRDQARLIAIRAAKEKAQALAGELGQQLDRPYRIEEEQANWFSPFGGWWGNRWGGAMQNVVQNVGPQAPSPEGALSPGQISVTSRVKVVFELQ